MKYLRLLIFSALIIAGSTIVVNATPKIAFGYLTNITKNKELSYLETVFPMSFASSIEKTFDVTTIKPLSLNKLLKKNKTILKKDYKEKELSDFLIKVKADFFVYGEFVPLPENRIKMRINLYIKSENKIFTFVDIGKMETEIFKLVDRISNSLFNYLSEKSFVVKNKIKKNSSIGILTNLHGKELNTLYYHFYKNNYKKIIGLNGNILRSNFSDELFNNLTEQKTKQNSISKIKKNTYLKYITGTWSSKKHIKKMKYFQSIFNQYDKNYINTRKNFLKSLKKAYSNKFDILLIIGFDNKEDNSSNSVWVRAIELKSNNLIWIEQNIKGNSIENIVSSILKKIEQ